MPTKNQHEKGHAGEGSAARGQTPREQASRGSVRPPGERHQDPPEAERHAEAAGDTKVPRKDLEKHIEELNAKADALAAEARDAKDKYLRALADFDNYRKRRAREDEERTRCANEDLILRLLEVVDNMERAVDASAGATDLSALRRGLELTHASLKDTLSREGLCPIECVGGKFDPNYHEAVMAVEKEGSQSDNVVEEIQKGYTLHGRVIRPSKVVVSK